MMGIQITRAMVQILSAIAIAGAAAGAQAQQSLARGVAVSDIGATMQTNAQTDAQTTTLRATLVNQRKQTIPLLTVRYELYDAQNAVVGEATASRADLAPGETWVAEVQTPVAFTRFTLMNVDAQ